MASLRSLQTLQPIIRKVDLMRMVVGILIVVDGYPLIFFFKETLRLAPGSTAFTAIVLGLGFILMVPTTLFRKLYRPNTGLLKLGLQFLGVAIFYMFFYPDQWFKDVTVDLMYYLFIFLFLILLLNIPNDIIEVFIPVVIVFTVISNLALVIAMITDPTWTIGQRAAINFGSEEERMGNPHVFARNAFMCVIACGIWATRTQTPFLVRILSIVSCLFSMAILVMTQTRSSILALALAVFIFFFFNTRPHQIKMAVRSLMKPASLFIVAAIAGVFLYLKSRNNDIYAILYGYGLAFFERNLENLYALLGIKIQNTYTATFDDSAANRATSFQYLMNVIEGHMHLLFLGQGYKSVYLDVPIMEALINLGILGFAPFSAFCAITFYYSLKAIRENPDPMSTFLAYFYILLFVLLFTGGRPYELAFWHPFCLMIRFMGIHHLFPTHLRTGSTISSASV